MLRLPHCEHRRRSRQSGTVVWCAVVRGYFGRVGLDVAKFKKSARPVVGLFSTQSRSAEGLGVSDGHRSGNGLTSFDDLVGAGEEGGRHGQSEGLCGLEVDH